MSTTNNQPPQRFQPRQPDYDVLQEVRMGRNTKLISIGGVYENQESGYISGDTVHGRLVLQPREVKEALQQVRSEQHTQGQQQTQAPTITH